MADESELKEANLLDDQMPKNAPGGTDPNTPHFERPPLNEVVCGVQFEPIAGWLTSHYGLFWSKIRDEYPYCEDQPPLPLIKLDQEQHVAGIASGPLPPLRRVFLLHQSRNYLIQLQPYRFLHNWRKTKDSDEYPRFDQAYARFIENWGRFRGFVSEMRMPALQPEVYELTYLNHIFGEGIAFPRDVWQFLNFYKSIPRSASQAEPTGMELRFAWTLAGDAGRLTMMVRHGKRTTDNRDVLLVELTAVGKAREREDDGIAAWFRIAHDSIVQTFAKLTTERAHELWGRIR